MTPEEYTERYPNHCKKCRGWGVFSWVEYHDGPKYPGELMTDDCDDCTAVGCCPRCLLPVMDNSSGKYSCNYCNWQEGDEGCPPIEEFPEPDQDFDEEVP